MQIRFIFSILALMGIFLGLSFIVPTLTDAYFHNFNSMILFGYTGLIVFFTSSFFYTLLKTKNPAPLKVKEMFLTTTLVWLFYSLIGSLPFMAEISDISFVDAWFESVSGLTTTGSTVLTHLDTLPKGLLMWRSMLQWIGGIGIIIVVLNVLPVLRVGGMQFFTTEFSGENIRQTPTITQTVHHIMMSFIMLTVLCTIALYWGGMNLFDALNHAMTTIATGGFSTHDESIGFYNSPKLEWILIFFMFIAGLPLVIWGQILRREWFFLRSQVQIKTYVRFVLAALFVLVLGRMIGGAFFTQETIRSSLFSIISVMTTTGFVSSNYMLWGGFSVLFFLLLLSVGACSGSTSGGIKMFRFAITAREMGTRLKSAVQPHAVIVARYGKKIITDEIASSVLFFFGLYALTGMIGALLLSLTGLDILTSISATLSSLANVGPGLGDIVGPEGTFASLSDFAKIICSTTMLLGRLELTSIIVLFLPFLWRKNT